VGKFEGWYDSTRFTTSKFHYQLISAGDCRGRQRGVPSRPIRPSLPCLKKMGPFPFCPQTDGTVDFTVSNRAKSLWTKQKFANRPLTVRELADSSTERNICNRLYMFRTMDDHFGLRTVAASLQHLQAISRTGESLQTVSHLRPHWSILHTKIFIWSLSHPKSPTSCKHSISHEMG
jgi:hypothetical protein